MDKFALHFYLSRHIFSLESSAYAQYSRSLVKCRFIIKFEQNILRILYESKIFENYCTKYLRLFLSIVRVTTKDK